MPNIVCLTTVPDPLDPNDVYGPGHRTMVADEAWVTEMMGQGKIAITDQNPDGTPIFWPPVPAEEPPP